ncbi:MAG: hypothetical protein PHS57_06305 [Alphaproteobacteria bacterium]|nr:hypothetical protein [Alphaproteobacteria bacterium]
MDMRDLFDMWSNGGCLGYAIRALEALDYKPEEIQTIVGMIKRQFDRYTVEEADKHYCKSPY